MIIFNYIVYVTLKVRKRSMSEKKTRTRCGKRETATARNSGM
jgi:hypothetical protein